MRSDEISESIQWNENFLHTCKRVVRTMCQKYDPSYSPTYKWDEDAYEEMMAGWMGKALLDKDGQFKAFIYNLENEDNFPALAQSFKWYLIDQRPRTEITNLYRRVNDCLPINFCCFIAYPEEAHRYWGKNDWSGGEPYQGSEEQLATHPELQTFRPVYYNERAEKNSPILSESSLPLFIAALMDVTHSLFSPSQITTVMSHRFSLSQPRNLSLYKPLRVDGNGNEQLIEETIPSGICLEDEALAREAAYPLYILMSALERQAFLFLAEKQTLQSIYESTGIPISTMHKKIEQTKRRVRVYLQSNVEKPLRALVLDYLLELIVFGLDIGKLMKK